MKWFFLMIQYPLQPDAFTIRFWYAHTEESMSHAVNHIAVI
jgi:hypothetical protein